MSNKFLGLIFSFLAIVSPFVGEVYADTFEFLNYSPPSGWSKQMSADKTTYQRTSGVGAIVFYPSYQATGSESVEFAKLWKTRVESILPGATPKPEIQRDGDYTAAVGGGIVNAKEGKTLISLTAFVSRGRVIGVLAMATSDEAIREVTNFFETIKSAPVISQPNSESTSSGAIEFDYAAPPGFTEKNDGGMIQLTPPSMNKITPCVYWLSPPRPSQGSLEADAKAAVLELPIERRSIDDRYTANRGTALDGWKYFLFGFDFRNSLGTTIAYGMALAFPAANGQVNIVLGVGKEGVNCNVNDVNFARLFHSLKPRSWTSDGGKAFVQELRGTWQNSEDSGIIRYNFLANGRYDSGYAASTTFGTSQTTDSNVGDGSYKLSKNLLTITPDRRDLNPAKYFVRVYEYSSGGTWRRRMSLFSEERKIEKDYDGIGN